MPDFNDENPELPSKSELKRQMLALQKLGEQLLDLPQKELDNLILPEQLMDALMLAKRIKNREGKRRQLQYIGKLMRTIDAEAIRQKLQQRDQLDQQKNSQFHALEQLRDELISSGITAVEQVLIRYPDADRSRLKQLLRSAVKEKQQQQPPKSARKLFRYLRELDELQQQSAPPAAPDQ
jgi:ribosome-associated protein